MNLTAQELRKKLSRFADKEKAKFLIGFFKTGAGQYAEGDKFLGVMVPKIRSVAKAYRDMTFAELQKLMDSSYNEERLASLLVLVSRFQNADSDAVKKQIFNFYKKNLKRVNNWNLVDASASSIFGSYLSEKKRDLLYKLAKSKNIWERRVAIISTFHFIRLNDFVDALRISEILMEDKEDLIHKAVGWMLREIGKRDERVLINFLEKHAAAMPRTALRYALEKLPGPVRKKYMEYRKENKRAKRN